MPLVKVNLSKIRNALIKSLPAKSDTQKALRAIAAAARAEWISLAQDELKSSSRDYVQGITKPIVTPGRAVIYLFGVVPNMVEQGWAERDLRQTILSSPKAKLSKVGYKYMAIPYRHGIPSSSGRNVGAPMPKPIYSVAKLLAPTFSNPMGVNRSAKSIFEPDSKQSNETRLLPGMDLLKRRKAAREILATKSKDWHTASIYSGMIRQVGMYGDDAASYNKAGAETSKKKTQSTYTTFRTISTNPKSDPKSWMHPGIKARHLAQKVQGFITKIASQIIKDAVDDNA